MLSSRSVYLRKKNEELLNVLKEDAVRLNRKLRDCKDLLRKNTEVYNNEEFSEYHHRHSVGNMSPTTRGSSRGGKGNKAELSQAMKARVRLDNSPSPIRLRSSSADEHHTRRSRHSSCVPSAVARRSSPGARWTKLQQQLACQAHMHAYTLSHSLSKCYCTRKQRSASCENISDSAKTPSDVASRKAKIPQRLKEKRYQAEPPKGKPCTVKWAVPSKDLDRRLPVDDTCGVNIGLGDCEQENETKSLRSYRSLLGQGDGPAVRAHREVVVDRTQHPTGKVGALHEDEAMSESESDWFAKVKNFRKSNWEDCHAPKQGHGDGNDCKCTRLFMLGERMFLEPVRTSEVDKHCYCSSKSREKLLPPSPRDNVVTLPKVLPDVGESDIDKNKEGIDFASNHRRGDRVLRSYNINRPCFLTGHKSVINEQARTLVHRRPADSFALRYQKGVDPRAV